MAGASGTAPENPELAAGMPEKRTDDTDGVAYAYEEYAAHYKSAYKKETIDVSWNELPLAKSNKSQPTNRVAMASSLNTTNSKLSDPPHVLSCKH